MVVLIALCVATQALAWQPARPRATPLRAGVPLRAESGVVETCALAEGAEGAIGDWLAAWAADAGAFSDPMFPVTVADVGAGAVRLRFVALPGGGVDVRRVPPGGDAPYGSVVVERYGPASSAGVAPLLRGAEGRVAASLRAGLAAADLAAPVAAAPQPAPAPAREATPPRDPALYGGSYGDAFEADVMDLVEPAPAPDVDAAADARLREMFAKGEALASAAREAPAPAPPTEPPAEAAAFEVQLGPDLRGGVDIFAGPPRVSGASRSAAGGGPAGAAAPPPPPREDLAGVAPETRARFAVLLREVADAPDASVRALISDAYRDVLLDDAFGSLARDAMSRAADGDASRVGAALDFLQTKVLELITQLAELASYAEKQHLETIRLLCDAAKTGGDAGLRGAAKTYANRLDADFVAYLKHAVALEADSLRAAGVLDPGAEPSAWLAVLDAVRTAAYSELGTRVAGDVDVLKNVLALKSRDTRRECLRLNVEGMARDPKRLRDFAKTADNIFGNLLDGGAEEAPDAALAEDLAGLRDDLAALLATHLPAEARPTDGVAARSAAPRLGAEAT